MFRISAVSTAVVGTEQSNRGTNGDQRHLRVGVAETGLVACVRANARIGSGGVGAGRAVDDA